MPLLIGTELIIITMIRWQPSFHLFVVVALAGNGRFAYCFFHDQSLQFIKHRQIK